MAAALDPEYAAVVEAVKTAKKRIKEIDDEFDPESMDLEIELDKNEELIEQIEEFARQALAAAEKIFENRAKFVVVGQLKSSKQRVTIPPSDPEAIKLSLGWYSTEGEARKAAESLWFSTASGDEFATWVLNVHHGTAADFHAKRKAHYVALEEKQREAKRERIRKSIEEGQRLAEARAEEARRIVHESGGQDWPCPVVIRNNGKCRHTPACR